MSGRLVPYVHDIHPKDLKQFEYIELGFISNGQKYALMIRDDHSLYG